MRVDHARHRCLRQHHGIDAAHLVEQRRADDAIMRRGVARQHGVKRAVAETLHQIDLASGLAAAFSRSSAVVGSSVVRSVAITPSRCPVLTAASAIASSTRITGKSNICCTSVTAGPIDEHVTITASAPPSAADSTMPSSRRIVTLRTSPARIVSLIRLSSTMWNTVVSGICFGAERAKDRRQRRACMNQC